METDISPLNQRNGIPKAAQEVVVGAAGGVTQVVIGQPFDIVKVRMQTQANGSALRIAQSIWKHEGALAFYKGSLLPLAGVGVCISIVYTSFHIYSQALLSLTPSKTLTPSQTYLSGGLAGLTNSLLSGPMEHIRIRLQTSPTPISLRTCISRILQAGGGPPGLFRGQSATMLREFHSYGTWFSVYEFLVNRTLAAANKGRNSQPLERGDLETWKIAGCGIVTGEVLWAANYPFDVVKSKMQADGFGRERVYRGFWDVLRRTWRVEGVRGFWRGLGPTLLRAGPVSGGTFVVVETVRKML